MLKLTLLGSSATKGFPTPDLGSLEVIAFGPLNYLDLGAPFLIHDSHRTAVSTSSAFPGLCILI